MTEPRPDLDELRRRNQVADDTMTTYTPRFLGIPLADGRRMTQTEADMLDGLGYGQLHTFKGISEDALSRARQEFPMGQAPAHVPADRAGEWRGTDGHLDAFRHAYWSARLTREFGEDWARAFTTAHEAVPGNRPTPEAMDLHNNGVGIRIARAHPNATDAELATLVRDAVRAGDMVVIDRNGKLEWSDRVAVGQHGLGPRDEAPLDGTRRVPEAVAPRYGAVDPPADPSRPDTRLARGPERLADEPALAGYLAALQSGDQDTIRRAAGELVQSPTAQRMADEAQQQLAAREPQQHAPRTQEGPSLA